MTTNTIKTEKRDVCPLCNNTGKNLYKSLKDKLFNVPGKWNIDQCTNQQCGLLWLNPMPKTEDLPNLYDKYYTHEEEIPSKDNENWLIRSFREGGKQYLKNKYGYSHKGTWLDSIFAQIIKLNPKWSANRDFSIFYLKAKPNGNLLEIGCGSGHMLKEMQNHGWQVTGVDFDPKSVEVARKKRLNVFLGDIFQQEFSDNTFDTIVMSHVIEHVPDPLALFTECNRLLKQDGKLISITPNTNGYNHKLFKFNSRILEPPRHLHLFNTHSLIKMAKQAGFSKTTIFSTIRDFSGLLWASKNIKSKGFFSFGEPIPLMHRVKHFFKEIIIFAYMKMNTIEGDELVIITTKTK